MSNDVHKIDPYINYILCDEKFYKSFIEKISFPNIINEYDKSLGINYKKRKPREPVPEEKKDAKYYKIRKQNNISARKSREKANKLLEIRKQKLIDVKNKNKELNEIINTLKKKLEILNEMYNKNNIYNNYKSETIINNIKDVPENVISIKDKFKDIFIMGKSEYMHELKFNQDIKRLSKNDMIEFRKIRRRYLERIIARNARLKKKNENKLKINTDKIVK